MFRGLDQRKQKFYHQVASIIKKINSNRGTIKSEIYKTKTPERYHALVHKVLLNFQILSKVVKKTEFMKNLTLGTVIAYEILTKNIRNDGFRRKLRQALGIDKLKEVKTKTFVRLNTLKGTVNDLDGFIIRETCIPNVYEILDSQPKEQVQVPDCSEDSSKELESYDLEESCTDSDDVSIETKSEGTIENQQNTQVSTSKTIKDLILLNLVSEKIKIQNFSSCLPAFVLNPELNSVVIDATASPGNKTTHLCSIMENTGKIYAFERNLDRFNTLKSQVEKYGASNIEAIHCDFLKVSPDNYKPDYILLDPSCSGSGIHINYEKDQKRIDTLHNFQAMILNHALKFGAKKVVYSVCSVHVEEGESVVKEALEKNLDYELECIPDYTGERGYDGFEFKDLVLRTSNEDNGKIGFFVALFRKKTVTQQ